MKKKGFRWTPARRIVWELMKSRPHSDADWLYVQAKQKIPSISQATVYRSLLAFRTAGMIRDVKGRHFTRWDTDTSDHHHFICASCHVIYDIVAVDLPVDLATLESRSFNTERFEVQMHGACPDCQRGGKTSPPA